MSTASRRFFLTLAVSVLLHVPVVWLAAAAMLRAQELPEESAYFEVAPFTRDEVDPRNPTEEQREEDEDYDPDEELPEGHVVDDAEPAGEERRPEEAELLASRDQVVEQQTRSLMRLRGARGATQPPPVPLSQGLPLPAEEPREERLLAGLIVQDRGMRPADRGDQPPDQAPLPVPPSPIQLQPSLTAMSDAVGGTGLDDLGDIEEGEQDLLSTARWLHAPFFQRVKHQVEQYWHPDVAFLQHDPGGHVYGYRNRETVIRVVLDGQGSLVRAYIVRQSGADFLDEEALGAIEQAAPFPNPPRGLVDERTGQIVFAFGFIVELGEQPIFRLRRYR